MRRHAFDLEKHGLDLLREHVHAADDQHVVGPAHDARHPAHGPSAGAGFRDQARKVAGPVADHGEGLFGERGDDHFADLAGLDRLQGLGIDELHQEVVLGDVQAVAFHALAGNAGSHHFGQAVVVRGNDLELAFELLPHGVRPGFGAEQSVFQGQGVGVDPHFHHGVGDQHGVARRAHERRGLEVLHDLDLTPRVAAGDRNDRSAEPLGPVVQAEGAGEQAVVEGDLDHIVLGDAAGGQHARHEVRPGLDVVPGVAHDRGHAGRSRRSVEADDLPERQGEQPVRIVVPQIALGRKGKLAEVFERSQIVGIELDLVEFFAVKGNVLVHPAQGRLEPLELQLRKLFPVHAFAFRLPVHISTSGAIENWKLKIEELRLKEQKI